MQRALFLAALLTLSACGKSANPMTGVGTFINVGISNSTEVELRVTVRAEIGEGDGVTVTAPPGYTGVEVSGTSGNVVVIVVRGALTGNGACTATNRIVGTDTYGEVNILPTGIDGAIVQCLFGWAESGG